MKKYLTALVLILTLSTSIMAAGQANRSKYRAPQVVAQDSVKAATMAQPDSVNAEKDSIVTENNAIQSSANEFHDGFEDGGGGDFWDFFHSVGGGILGTFIVIVALICIFGVSAMPFVVLIFLIKYLVKRSENRRVIMEKAVENGQPLPEIEKKVNKQIDENLWQKGIKLAAIGLGLMLLFGFMGAHSIIGVGGLVLCIGLGQMFAAWSSTRKHDKKETNDELDDLM